MRRPGTRRNARSLLVTRVRSRATASAAMIVSSDPIGVPARSSLARTRLRPVQNSFADLRLVAFAAMVVTGGSLSQACPYRFILLMQREILFADRGVLRLDRPQHRDAARRN